MAKVTHLLYDDGFKLALEPECDEIKNKIASLGAKMAGALYCHQGDLKECAEETYHALGLLFDFWTRINCPKLSRSIGYRRL